MSFNLDQFRTNLPFGGARSALFEMTLRWPTPIQAPQSAGFTATGSVAGQAGGASIGATATITGGQGTDVTRFLCKVSEIPASTIAPVELSYFGRKLQYPGDRTFAPLSITIINDESFNVRASLEKWMERIAYHRSAGGATSGSLSNNEYVTNAVLTQYARTGEVIREYLFNSIWPSELGAIGLSWESSNAIEDYTCQWQYSWWEAVGTTRGGQNAGVTVGFESRI